MQPAPRVRLMKRYARKLSKGGKFMITLSPFESWLLLAALGLNVYFFIKYVIFNDTDTEKDQD
jgi:hypothetical protein